MSAPGMSEAIRARAERRSVSHANDDVWALLDEVDRLQGLASEQAAALDLMSKQFQVMQREKEHGWREAEKWEDKAGEQAAALARVEALAKFWSFWPTMQGNVLELRAALAREQS